MPTYNPVRPLTMLDKLSDLYWSKPAIQFGVDLAFFIVGCAIIAAAVVAAS